jgi:archaeosine synthase
VTKYFEVLRRDGPARLGRLTLEKTIDTPGIISREDYVSAGSIFEFRSLEEAVDASARHSEEKEKMVVPPYVPSALHSEPPCSAPSMETRGPKGFVIHPLFDECPEKADVYILSCAGALKNPRDIVSALVRARNEVPSDTAIYAPALATPSNLAFLTYLGADLVDTTRARIDGYYGRYHTRDGVRQLSDFSELPCSCRFCSALSEKEKNGPEAQAELLAGHNVLKLVEEIVRIREMIRSESMREYIERQVRVDPGLTAALRLLDQEHTYLEERTPQIRKSTLYANTAESLSRVEVTRFAARVISRYSAPKSDVLLLLPCSARKPYSRSRSHRLFEMALGSTRRYLHELILTSPLALVPRELEEVYPASSYDVPVTGRWDLEERSWLLKCLDAYLEKNRYARIVAHIEGELREAVESHGIDAVYTGGGTSPEALKNLSEAAYRATKGAARLPDHRILKLKAVVDYYFGPGAGETLFSGKVKLRGYEVMSQDKKTLGRMTPNGSFAISIEGARRLEPLGRYIVRIGDFLPRGSLLAPGVVDADDQIRPGDEVIILGEKAFGVGRAKMSGWEMRESTRGVAAEIRRIEEA